MPLRVLLLHIAPFGHVGGVEVMVRQLTDALAQDGVTCSVACMDAAWRPVGACKATPPFWSIAAPSQPELRRPRSWASYVRSAAQLQAAVAATRPDVVHVHHPGSQCLPFVAVSMLPKRWRSVLTFHGMEGPPQSSEALMTERWRARAIRRAHGVTAVSRHLASLVEDRYRDARGRCRVVYNGVADEWVGSTEREVSDGQISRDGHRFVFVGRLHHVKGVDLLLRAWHGLAQSKSPPELVIVGSGPLECELARSVEVLGLSKSVRMVGRCDPVAVRSHYQGASTFVLPSRAEGFPVVLLEAASAGLPAVVARVGGIPEFIEEGRTGFLVEPESHESLRLGIERMLSLDAAARAAMGEAARHTVLSRYTVRHMVAGYQALYDEVLAS